MDVLRLRFDSALMSFGSVIVDQHNVTDRFPTLSMLTGLFGNALGYCHNDHRKLTNLQERIEFAARWDIEPEAFVDYQTVDLNQPHMSLDRKGGWTTRGYPEWRAGGNAARLGTHQRYRHYWANGVMTLAVSLLGKDIPTTNSLKQALKTPVRPLFLGRKSCLPSTPIVLDLVSSGNVLDALSDAPRARQGDRIENGLMSACWPLHLNGVDKAREVRVYDIRDWNSQVHTGSRKRLEGLLIGNDS